MKNFVIMGVSLKNPIVRGAVRKNQHIGGITKTGWGFVQFADLRGGLAKKGGWCF